MQTRTKLLAAGAGILGVAAVALTLQPLLAYQGDPSKKGPNYSPERHEQMEQAFENNDYAAWKNLMQGRGRVTQVVNEGNFARFAEAHRLAEEGKINEAKEVRKELGLGLRDGQGKGNKVGRGNGNGNCPYASQNK